jgi:predicted nucleic acid-binding protein
VIAYLDSSVLLRVVLGQAGALREWKAIRAGVASSLVEVECLRTLDRLCLRARIPDREIATRRETIFRILETLELIEPTRPVLSRAAHPLPTELGTLDAIHLATALLWREGAGADLVMATHDLALGTASRSCGLPVIGVARQ